MNKFLKQLIVMVFLSHLSVSFSQNVDMTVTQGPNVDVMVTVGSANLDLSTFEDDLEQAMHTKGIPLGKLRVEAFERSSISSDQADAGDIFNSWNVMDFTGAEPPNSHNYLSTAGSGVYSGSYFSFNSTTNEVLADPVARNSGNYGVAMYDPTGDVADGTISATFGLSGAPYTHAEVGFIFRKIDNDNFYAYIIDNHTACGNLMNYAPGDGFPAEAILKRENGVTTILAVNTNSGTNGSATYGWNANRADMFAAFYNGQSIDFKIEMSGNDINISRRGGGGSAGTDWIQSFSISDATHSSGSYGFYVHEQQNAYFKDINIEKLELRAFKDVLREPQWRNSALRFNVNLDDLEVADFDVDSDLSEILMRTINEDIHYIGWGVNANKAQFERFTAQNNTQGTFVNRDETSYSSWIDQIAQYIYEQYLFGTVTNGDYFIAGTSVEIDVAPAELKTNTANASYPNGRWKITHDETLFPNNTGKVSWNNLYLDDVPEFYEKTGKYTFSFEDLPTSPTTLFFHRKPIASFTYNSGTGTLTNNSYDLDGGASNGIAQSEWKWKSVDAGSTADWTMGQFSPSGQPDGQYLIMLKVQDHQGTWSKPASVYVEKTAATGGSDDLPLAEFNIMPDVLTTYSGGMTISIQNNSSDPFGRSLTAEEWNVIKRVYDTDGNPTDTQIYNAGAPMTDFSAYNTGNAEYIISFKTQTDTGVWSLPFYRTLTIIDDSTNPTITASPANGNITTDDTIQLTFQDEGSGSGFDVQRYVLNQSVTAPPSDDSSWRSWSNSQSKNVSFSSGGTWYIHAQAKDNAGNIGVATFGPYNLTLILSAEDDLALTDEDTDSSPINVLYNDSYDTGGTVTVTIFTQGTLGTAVVDGDNNIVYTPDTNKNGTDTVVYQIDNNGSTTTGSITVSIQAVDDAPIAIADSFNLDENATLNEDVSTNDEEVDGDALIYYLVDGPAHAASFTFNNDGTFTYENNGDEVNTDSFTYRYEDANNFSNTITATLNITLQNDLPQGGDVSLEVVENVGYSFATTDFTFSDVDVNDGFHGIQVIGIPSPGTLTYNGTPVQNNDLIDDVTKLVYTTATDGYGTDYTSFTFKVKDNSDAVSTEVYTMSLDALLDTDGDSIPDITDTDDDDDGTPDAEDDFPLDENEDTDTDGDGTGDNADTDDDNDGTPDTDDDFPLDENEDTDTDGDGTGDNTDTDDDNDGTPDAEDDFPLDENEDTDTDGDGTGDNADTDDDNDGTPDADDDLPLNPDENTDTDGDGIGDNADTDDDGDGEEDTDTDGDGTGDNIDTDDDNDGTPDADDDFPLDPDEDTDTDGDGTGDNADTDDDNDGYSDELEDREETDTKNSNSTPDDNDNDGIPDSEDPDDDNDGVLDSDDDFPNSSEPSLVPAEAFTPNGDGINDTWIIPGIDNYSNSLVRVYNRYGHEVFATKGYKNDWNGIYKSNSEKLPSGSYLYVIDLGNGSAPLKGWLFINY
ncbi:gliding motility-associated C-terminal domain-containing protein [Thalassobellus citreus]|uniref:T9SS type B sorting domain-containing protein n=1 Tax=Thalassobellus citreus TaxID=3367752 RepID=UPI0037A6483B